MLNPKLIHSIAVHEVNPLNDTHSPQYILVDRNIMAQGNSHTGIYRNCFRRVNLLMYFSHLTTLYS